MRKLDANYISTVHYSRVYRINYIELSLKKTSNICQNDPYTET